LPLDSVKNQVTYTVEIAPNGETSFFLRERSEY
jgi:hypothetical protein